MKANSEVVQHEKKLFAEQANLCHSERLVRPLMFWSSHMHIFKHIVQGQSSPNQNRLAVRELEHEQIKKRLRKAELEAKVLSVELVASAQRVQDAHGAVQSLQTTPTAKAELEAKLLSVEPATPAQDAFSAVQSFQTTPTTNAVRTPSGENTFLFSVKLSATSGDRQEYTGFTYPSLPPCKSYPNFELPFLANKDFKVGIDDQ